MNGIHTSIATKDLYYIYRSPSILKFSSYEHHIFLPFLCFLKKIFLITIFSFPGRNLHVPISFILRIVLIFCICILFF